MSKRSRGPRQSARRGTKGSNVYENIAITKPEHAYGRFRSRMKLFDETVTHGPVRVLVKDGKPVT